MGALVDILKRIPGVTVVEQSRPGAAVELVRRDHFDACFIDLHLNDAPLKGALALYEGIGAIESIRGYASHVAIVAYSAAFERNEEQLSPLYGPCIKADADRVIARTALMSMASTDLAELLAELVAARLAKVGRPLDIATDLATRAAVARVGENELSHLLAQLLPNMSRHRVQVISGGYSGALVFDVESNSLDKLPAATKTIVKLSASSYAMQDELARRPMIGTSLRFLTPPASDAPTRAVHGWTGIVFGKILDRVPLSTLIAKPPANRSRAVSTMERVVDAIYITPARDAQALAPGSRPEGEYRLSATAAAALDDALRQLIELRYVVQPNDRSKAKSMRTYLTTLIDGRAALVSPSGLFALLHGDLHADNVFASTKSDPMLIDFERADVYPRLFDIAALDVDLMLRRIDAEGGRQFDFGRVDQLEQRLLKSFPFNTLATPPPKAAPSLKAPELLRRVLHYRMRSKLPDVRAAEYGAAVMFQLLRYLKFESVSVPRRVLGIRLAGHLRTMLDP